MTTSLGVVGKVLVIKEKSLAENNLSVARQRLEGWVAIADYLKVSSRTAQRWEKEDPTMPVHREKINGRPFAFAEELECWRNPPVEAAGSVGSQQHGREQHGSKPQVGQEKTAEVQTFRPWLLWLLAFVVLCSIGAARFFFEKPLVPPKLHLDIKSRRPGSVLYLKNDRDQTLLTIQEEKVDWSISKKVTTLSIVDIDRDGLEDVAYAPFLGNRVEIYRQQTEGHCELRNTWSVKKEVTYGDVTYDRFQTVYLDCHDFTGDGVPEVLLMLQHHTEFPMLLLLYDLEGRQIFELRHPGRLKTALVMNRNGFPTVYLVGTNNFIEPGSFSAPIVMSLEGPLSELHQLDLMGPERTMIPSVPAGMRLRYLSFKKDRVSGLASDWEGADLERQTETSLRIYVGDMPGWPGKRVRQFNIGLDLENLGGYTPAEWARRIELDVPAMTAAGLYEPIYWNGRSWQTESCLVATH